jgi:AMP deaminase
VYANQHPSRDHTRTNSSAINSPNIASINRETAWPVDGFTDLHLSGSEPRIFPGLVSRTQRRDSVARKGSMSETDEQFSNAPHSRKTTTPKNVRVAVEEESDGEMEEAGGMDD